MTASGLKTTDRAVRVSIEFLQNLLGSYQPRDFAVRLWEGTTWEAAAGQPTRFTLVLKHPGALRLMFLPPNELTLAEAYIYDDFDIEGDFSAVFALADHVMALPRGWIERLRYGSQLLSLPVHSGTRARSRVVQLSGALHSKERDRQAVTYHYNVSNDFYALWLDRRMVYSCAYFASPEDDLDTAQERKLDYLCRKIRLSRGQRLLDIGCGWGALVIYAGQHYGAEVLGITLSQPQAVLANERIRQAGLSGRCRVEVCDYRDCVGSEAFDKVVSVGMVEHVGEAMLPDYFKQAWRLLRQGGVFLNHGVSYPVTEPADKGPSFATHYVFPDLDLVSLVATVRFAEEAGFEVRDVESLREHYNLTMRHWVNRLLAHHDEACQITDETTWRAWRLFFEGSAYKFRISRCNVYQTLLAKPDKGHSTLPLSRADWYNSAKSNTP